MLENKTHFGVFIIETLRDNEFHDGKHLHSVLKVSKIPVRYTLANTKTELKKQLESFKRSGFRYLHISCHADENGIEIKGEIKISNIDFQELIGHIPNRRVFLSACQAANDNLAGLLIIKSSAISVAGSPVDIDFDESAVFWPSFYYVMKKFDNTKMTGENLKAALKDCVGLFKIPINYYSKIKNDPLRVTRWKIGTEKRMDNRTLIVRH